MEWNYSCADDNSPPPKVDSVAMIARPGSAELSATSLFVGLVGWNSGGDDGALPRLGWGTQINGTEGGRWIGTAIPRVGSSAAKT